MGQISVDRTPDTSKCWCHPDAAPDQAQVYLRAFYDLFGRLGLTMICEATLDECLNAGLHEIDALHESERSLQAYREALCSMAAAIQSLDLESDYYVDGRRHPTVKSKLTSVLSDVEALLAKGDKK